MAEAAFNLADWILLADVGEHMRQKNDGHRGLARGDVQAALEAGCGLMLRWVGDDGREVCREEFFKRDSWEDILVWAGLPQRLCVQLPTDERKGNLPYPYAYLLRADAVRLGLLPASELPQAKQQSERLPQPKLDAWIAEHGLALTGSRPKEGWDKFYDRCRDDCDGWADKKNGMPAAGFSNKTIERRLQHAGFKPKRDK
jgi:hypothetical protein